MNNVSMRFPGGLTKAFTLSYDDGFLHDIRLAEIFDKNGLKCTFNINTNQMTPEDVQTDEKDRKLKFSELEAIAKNHEIAVHTLNHPRLNTLKPINIINEILEDRRNIERETGQEARGMAYPFGNVDDEVVKLANDVGIAYSRLVAPTHGFQLPTDWLRLNPTCHHDDAELFNLTERFVNESPRWDEVWLMYIWGHSYEFYRKNNWERIEDFAERIGGHGDIWYATNIEIYDYVQAYKNMRISALSKKVYNPTSQTLWFDCDGKIMCVKSGEEICL